MYACDAHDMHRVFTHAGMGACIYTLVWQARSDPAVSGCAVCVRACMQEGGDDSRLEDYREATRTLLPQNNFSETIFLYDMYDMHDTIKLLSFARPTRWPIAYIHTVRRYCCCVHNIK